MRSALITTLEKTSLEKLAQSWERGFSDYAVKITMPPAVLQNVLQQNGVRLDLSIGAFDGDNLVGFWINGVRKIDDVLVAYDSGTAIWPEYRSLGISKLMAERSNEILKNAGVRRYVLEVLQDNKRAFEIYKKDGFEVTRELICFSKKLPFTHNRNLPKDCRIECIPINEEFFRSLPEMEYVPSWQNRMESALSIGDKLTGIVATDDSGALAYAILHKARGRLLQAWFSKKTLGGPIPGAIMANAASNCKNISELSIINVSKDASKTCSVFKDLNFSIMAMQYEMKKELG